MCVRGEKPIVRNDKDTIKRQAEMKWEMESINMTATTI